LPLQPFKWPAKGPLPPSFRGAHPQLPLLEPSNTTGLTHAYVASRRLFLSHQSRTGDSTEGLKLQEVPSSSWTTRKPARFFNKPGSFLNNPRSSWLEVLRSTCIRPCPFVSAVGPTAALPSPSGTSSPDVRHHLVPAPGRLPRGLMRVSGLLTRCGQLSLAAPNVEKRVTQQAKQFVTEPQLCDEPLHAFRPP